MSVERLIASHLRLAGEPLGAAEALMNAGNRYAAYLAEQAVGHLILAFAQAEGTAFSRSQQHQLETMRRALPDANAFKEQLAALTWVEAYATTYRYPKTMGGLADPPRTDRILATIDGAKAMLNRAAEYFDVDLAVSATVPAAHARPPRM